MSTGALILVQQHRIRRRDKLAAVHAAEQHHALVQLKVAVQLPSDGRSHAARPTGRCTASCPCPATSAPVSRPAAHRAEPRRSARKTAPCLRCGHSARARAPPRPPGRGLSPNAPRSPQTPRSRPSRTVCFSHSPRSTGLSPCSQAKPSRASLSIKQHIFMAAPQRMMPFMNSPLAGGSSDIV